MQLLSASSRSAGQRERLRKALDVPVTAAGLWALRQVQRHDRLTIGELGRRLDVDQSTISRQVRPLEEQGLLVRRPDPDDGRISWLTVSPAGAAVLARIEAVARNDFDAALAGWSRRRPRTTGRARRPAPRRPARLADRRDRLEHPRSRRRSPLTAVEVDRRVALRVSKREPLDRRRGRVHTGVDGGTSTP